ncbi:MAG TPA: NAD-dependent epimerase/dehydratase family protein, partial [Actinomycetota bacterium]|nr:NAD-dependent epimerase/dehydratase family protein [Actinomycetota bacterium]
MVGAHGLKVAITGATGNVGTSLIKALQNEPRVGSIVGIARRQPESRAPKVTWRPADIVTDDLVRLFEGCDVVVHLAWLIQPSRDLRILHATNVEGSRRVFEAAAAAGVPSLVYASSIGAYSPGPKDDAGVDESWPTEGVPSSFYSRHKAETESMLDRFERDNPRIRVVRLRPGLIFKRESAAEVRRLFFGPLLPGTLLRRSLIPFVPDIDELRFQVVHSLDVGEAYRLAIVKGVSGAFNVATDPVMDPARLGELLGARPVKVPARLLKIGADVTWKLRLQPTPSGWLDMALQVPVMDTTRARTELGWKPRFDAGDAILELLEGLREGAGMDTPPLDPKAGGPGRIKEL